MDAPLDADCGCPVCARFSRAFLRHLYLAKEMNAPMYLSCHNLYFYFQLMRDIRAAIERDDYAPFMRVWLTRYHAKNDVSM